MLKKQSISDLSLIELLLHSKKSTYPTNILDLVGCGVSFCRISSVYTVHCTPTYWNGQKVAVGRYAELFRDI